MHWRQAAGVLGAIIAGFLFAYMNEPKLLVSHGQTPASSPKEMWLLQVGARTTQLRRLAAHNAARWLRRSFFGAKGSEPA